MKFKIAKFLTVALSSLLLITATSLHAAPPFNFQNLFSQNIPALRGHDSPEEAAVAMTKACANRNLNLYLQTRLLFCCEGKNDWPNRYAEFLHSTKFSTTEGEFDIYDLCRRMKPDTIKVIKRQEIELNAQITVYGEKYIATEVEIKNENSSKFRTLVIVAKLDDKWYAISQCFSTSLYYQRAKELLAKE